MYICALLRLHSFFDVSTIDLKKKEGFLHNKLKKTELLKQS